MKCINISKIQLLLLLILICLTGCTSHYRMEEDLVQTDNNIIMEALDEEASEKSETDDFGNKPINSFSWEKNDEDEKTSLYINGEVFKYRFLENDCMVFSKGLTDYWRSLAKIQKDEMPSDLYEFVQENYR